MQQFHGAIGAISVVAWAFADMAPAELGVTSGDIALLRRESLSDAGWLFGATLWAPLSRRDWIVTVAVFAFTALNFYLWSLPIS